MGLDNGIYIRYNIDNLPEPDGHVGSNYLSIPYALYQNLDLIHVERDKDNDICLCAEVVYWRKWWGVRNQVVNYLEDKYHTTQPGTFSWSLDTLDCYTIIEILRDFDNEETWENEGRSIWEYKECNIHYQIQEDIAELKRIIDLLNKKDPRVKEIYFYDSY